jgi:hypothetical protein
MLAQTLVSFVAYCVAFDMAYPKQDPMKRKTNFKVEQLIIKVKTIVKDISTTTKHGCNSLVLVH